MLGGPPAPCRSLPPPGALGTGAEYPPLLPALLELRDKLFNESRRGLLELFGSTRLGWVFGASGVSSFGAEFAGASVFGAGADGGGGWLAFGFTVGALGNSFGSTLGCGTTGTGSGSGGATLRKTRGSTFTLGAGVIVRGSGRDISNAPGGRKNICLRAISWSSAVGCRWRNIFGGQINNARSAA